MNIFDPHSDAPYGIEKEGETVTIKHTIGIPSDGMSTVTWTFPFNSSGCQDPYNSEYAGIVVIISNNVITYDNSPKNGIYYKADPTADIDLHVGDKISGARVIGAFYESDLKSRHEPLTSSFILSDVKQNTPYYIAGYIVDSQGRYHKNGVRAYSDEYSNNADGSTPSYQIIKFDSPITESLDTGLSSGVLYEFEMDIYDTFPNITNRNTVKFSEYGDYLQKYSDLLASINRAICLYDNPFISPTPPDAMKLYLDRDSKVLSRWDGYSNYTRIDTIFEAYPPSLPVSGMLWFDTTNLILKSWNAISSNWNIVDYYSSPVEPSKLFNIFWFNGMNFYSRCGTTWEDHGTIISNSDPSYIEYPKSCGHYWFNTKNEKLYALDQNNSVWNIEYAISWDENLNSLSTDTYWFDNKSNKLYSYNSISSQWIEILSPLDIVNPQPSDRKLIISDTQPQYPVENTYWYSKTTEELKLWDNIGSQWNDNPVIVWPTDPTDHAKNKLWWNSLTNQLYTWDVVHVEFDLVGSFIQSNSNPYGKQIIESETIWYNPTTKNAYIWDGSSWGKIEFIDMPTDPEYPISGSMILDSSSGEFYTYSSSNWSITNVIESKDDISLIPPGSYWFDSINSVLYEKIGSQWYPTQYSTSRYNKPVGYKWYNTSTSKLMSWAGDGWVNSTPIASAKIDNDGNIQISTSGVGSKYCVMIIVPELPTNQNIGKPIQDHEYGHTMSYEFLKLYPTTASYNRFLFNNLNPNSKIYRQLYGTDGVSKKPAYKQVGVGTDGTPDERRNLANRIRSRLGYPLVEVEVTPYQIDIAIDLALETLRERSSLPYRRVVFFLDVETGKQHYKLTNTQVGFNKIVSVMAAYRFSPGALTASYGQDLYGAAILQHLYSFGSFDLLSYHMVAQYIEEVEKIFASKLTYQWYESDRTLSFNKVFRVPERVLLDCMIERTEQDIMSDRLSKNWIERFALAETMRILAQVRGKYASLPGAGGGVSLNASDLMAQHDALKTELLAEIDNLIVNDIDNIGLGATFVMG